MSLTDGYLSVPDKSFTGYIEQTLNFHTDGYRVLSAQELMHLAKSRYDHMKVKKQWLVKQEDPDMVAMQATVKRLTLDKQLRDKKEKEKGDPAKSTEKTDKKSKKKGKQKPKYDPNAPENAWKRVPPKPGQTSITKDNKTFEWCKHHASWVMHKEKDCNKGQHQAAGSGTTKVAYEGVYEEYGAMGTI